MSAVRIACAQLMARDLEEHERALEEALTAVAEAAAAGAELVVLPECTYPAYVLADPSADVAVRPDDEVERLFAGAARDRGVWLAVGLAQGWAPGARDARNAALLFAPDGTVQLRTAKRLLWDFDGRWFAPGGGADPVAWLPAGSADASSVGILVCADARMPEIARSLAVGGARLILDPTAWVATGRESPSLHNLQPEYLMSVRALENGVWIAAADKVGMERGAVVYAGQSCVIGPDGSVAAMASSDEPEIVLADIDLSAATGPPVARRPELYGAIAEENDRSEVATRVAQPTVASRAVVRLGLLQSMSPAEPTSLAAAMAELRTTARALGLGLVAATVADGGGGGGSLIRSLSADLGAAVGIAVIDGQGRTVAMHVGSNGNAIVATATHRAAADPEATLAGRTTDVGPLRVGAIVGAEGLVPEAARIVTLQGAELLLWVADAGTPRALEVARVRAVENRVWVGVLVPAAATSGGEPLGALVDPDGRVVAIALRGRDHLVAGVVNVATARLKTMAPGTDVISSRQPETYGVLTEAPSAVRS